CRCPLRGWHSSGRGILLDPDSLLATGDLLTRNPLALRMYRLWEYGAQNITETAEFLRSLGVQYGVRISPEP
ncbi:MAG TPA: hypothetical protein VFP32_00560, partial [Candidatus Saccharimonadales bacterium]|nr:hypothetical protein [Candidatus Saccharimonadales bacterium]